MKQCIFCKSDLAAKGRAKEHIFSRWLQIAWNLSDRLVEPTHFDVNGDVLSTRSQVFNAFVSGNVCSECNNGWMSQLEAACKGLILSLAHDHRRLADISDKEALLLARWTVKTAYSLHAASYWRKLIPDEHYAVLDHDEYRLPSGVYVVGHTYKSSSVLSWSQSTTWPIFHSGRDVSASEVEEIKRSGYKISLRIGGLFLMVFFVSHARARACLWKYRHIPLYPRWSHPVAWQVADKAWPSNLEARFHIFHQMLSLSIVDESGP